MNMKGAMAFIRGLGLGNGRAAIYAWFFNFLFSLFVYWGFYKLFANAAGSSVIAADTIGEVGLFTFLSDVAVNHDGGLSLVFSLALVAGLLYFTVSVFLAGGIYSALVGDERPTFTNLMACSFESFFSMIKVLLVNLLNLLVTLIIPVVMVIVFVSNKSWTTNEAALSVFWYIWFPLLALFLTFSTAIYDFTRIFKLKDDQNVFRAFKKAIRFTFSNKLNVLIIFLLYALAMVILYLIYSIVINLLGNLLMVILLFLLYQGFVLVRYYIKIAVMQAEVILTQEGHTVE